MLLNLQQIKINGSLTNKYYDYEKRNYDADGTDSYITVKLNAYSEIQRIELGVNENNEEIYAVVMGKLL